MIHSDDMDGLTACGVRVRMLAVVGADSVSDDPSVVDCPRCLAEMPTCIACNRPVRDADWRCPDCDATANLGRVA